MKTIPLIIALAATSASGATIKGGYVACLTEDLYDQAVTAVARRDYEALVYLTENGCVVTDGGQRISVLKSSLFGGNLVRVYTESGTVEVYVPSEAIEE